MGYLTAILAGIPPAPPSGPVNQLTITSSSKIGILLPLITDDGGSLIISYNLMMDDGQNGDFFSVSGGDSQGYNM